MEDTYKAPFSVKLLENYVDSNSREFLDFIINNRKFEPSCQKIGNVSKICEKNKIRLDYTLTKEECSYIDEVFVGNSQSGCNLRERWRLLYYNGEQNSFRDEHTDWTKHSNHRRMSIVISLSDPNDYEGGELVFRELNLRVKLAKHCAVIFDSKLIHEVLPVTKGKRYVIQCFMFDESGWTLRNQTINKGEYTLQSYKKFLVEKVSLSSHIKNNWEILDNYNAVYCRVKNKGENYLGTFSALDEVLAALEKAENAYVFTWKTPNYSKKEWASHAYYWTYEKALENNRSDKVSWKYEDGIVSGKIISKYLIPFSPDGGPGNQVVSFKESILMAKKLNRYVAVPPVVQHYTLLRKSTSKNWNFSDIFTHPLCIDLTDNIVSNSNINYKFRNELEYRSNEKWKETVKNIKTKVALRKIQTSKDYSSFENNEQSMILTGIFNNTRISDCYYNGCDTCKINPDFYEDYKTICKELDFTKKIKDFADKFLESKGLKDFIAVHIRYDDLGKENFDDLKLYNYIRKSSDLPIFVATNKQNKLTVKDFITLEPVIDYNGMESFIEQYICIKGSKFYYNGGGLAKPTHVHLRSTWASFVTDYRIFKINNLENYYLSTLEDYI